MIKMSLSWLSYFYSFWFWCQLEVTCMLILSVDVLWVTTSGLYFHVFRLRYRGKRRQLIKKPILLLFIQRETTVLWNLFLSWIKYCEGNDYVIKACNKFLYGTFYFGRLFVLTRFKSVPIFNGFILLVSVMLLHALLNLNVWLISIFVWCLTYW